MICIGSEPSVWLAVNSIYSTMQYMTISAEPFTVLYTCYRLSLAVSFVGIILLSSITQSSCPQRLRYAGSGYHYIASFHHPLLLPLSSPLLSFLFSLFFSPFLFFNLPALSGSAIASILLLTRLPSLLSFTSDLTLVRLLTYSVVPSFF